MRRPFVRNLALWVVATALATGISAVGVSIVTARVADANAVVLGTGAHETAAAPVTVAPSTTSTTVVAAGPTTVAPTPTVVLPAPPPPTTFTAPGGIVNVVCNGDDIQLLSARPNDGFLMAIRSNGPAQVDVDFTSSSRRTNTVSAVCADGTATRVGPFGGGEPPPSSPSFSSPPPGGGGVPGGPGGGGPGPGPGGGGPN